MQCAARSLCKEAMCQTPDAGYFLELTSRARCHHLLQDRRRCKRYMTAFSEGSKQSLRNLANRNGVALIRRVNEPFLLRERRH